MRILIIEDEAPAFNRLSKLIQETLPIAVIEQQVDSIQSAKEWFAGNPLPDVIFMDIHLADGSAFALTESMTINCPIIFTTAFDEYALEAFKTNGVDYLLKPVKKQDLQRSFQKIKQLSQIFRRNEQPGSISPQKKEYKKRFIIRFGEHIKTIGIEDIAYFYSENRTTFARNFEGRNFPVDYNLDSLEQMLDPDLFYRINRQYLVCLRSIAEMKTYSKARVIITLAPPVKEQPVVSSERSASFKQWLGDE